MAKSTVHAALASLQFKFQAKIREVGKLKKQLTEGNSANVEVQRLRLRVDTLNSELAKSEKANRLTEFALAQADAAYRRLQSHIQDVDGVLKEARADVASWKSFTGIALVLGVAVGALGALAYVAQTTPL